MSASADDSTVGLESGSQLSETHPFKKRSGAGVCTKKHLAILAIVCIVVFAVVVGVAVGMSNNAKISEAPLRERVKRAQEILDQYPLVDG